MSRENKIHIAFGFHVNCYHSYRGDTNDSLGFGSDIRIIEKIISVLNDLNEQGIPVKGTWDTENFFSLEKILPEYAPHIIEGMKERVKKYGDENIIMGYSNGALSAMTEDEFCASIDLAVTNPEGSGLMDIFGECEKIVRPQEVMFTPSQVSLYNKCGVKAVCLYYSCIPFDAFRTLIPPLPDEQAFNPVKFTYEDESMLIIPTYSNADVCDAGCLRNWVKELRKKQVSGEINKDMFLFVNMDADAAFWESLDIPIIGNRIANLDGIHGLVKEVSDLDFVVFDTPGGYLKNHEAVGEITFNHDTADGNFTGYASWSEKPYNRKVWTALERGRAMSKVTAKSDKLSPSFKERVLLLSTTHFGLATPVLNIQREKTANELADKVIEKETENLPKTQEITVYNTTDSTFQVCQLSVKSFEKEIIIKGEDVKDFFILPNDNDSVFALISFKRIKKKYVIEVEFAKEKAEEKELFELSTPSHKMTFSSAGISRVYFNSKQVGDRNFIESYITYDEKKYYFKVTNVKYIPCHGNGNCIRVSGKISLPDQITGGEFFYDFFTFAQYDMIFVRPFVKYPYTLENDSISTENSTLGRYTDMKWTEAVPFEITPYLRGERRVIKRNFMEDISSYMVGDFERSNPKNDVIDSFNNHLTAGIVGLADENMGLVVANCRQVLNSMAHCPMRLFKNGTVKMNPFGTYYGAQRNHWSRSDSEIFNVYTLIATQGKSIGPAYNSVSNMPLLALHFFEGNEPNEKNQKILLSFADGCVVTAPENAEVSQFTGENVTFEKSVKTGEKTSTRNPILNGIDGNIPKYITRGTKAILHIIKSQFKAK